MPASDGSDSPEHTKLSPFCQEALEEKIMLLEYVGNLLSETF